MSTGKNGRKKKIAVKQVIVIILIIVAAVWGVDFFEVIPDDVIYQEQPQEVYEEQSQYQSAEGELILTMIDAGQADSFLLVQNGETALVDCGTRSTGEDVVEYLQSQGITKIDYLFGTHPHDDHMGGMYDVITNFEIGTIILPEIEEGQVVTNWYIKLMEEIETGEYSVQHAEVGDVYNLGQATMKIIGPMEKFPDNLNNYSTILKVSFGQMDIIMTGDAETDVEEQLVESGENLDAEILKVGHHGSDTSTTEAFLDAVSPDYALISAGLGNKYEHPTEETMQKLEEREIEVYRTDESGTVVAKITSESVSFNTSPGDYLSGVELEAKEGEG